MNNEEPEFIMPDSLLEKIYELSGDSEKYKGFILCAASESGSPMVYSKFDSIVSDYALRKSLEQWLIRADDQETTVDDI